MAGASMRRANASYRPTGCAAPTANRVRGEFVVSVKSKVLQLYHFLKAANELRFRPVRVLAEQPKVVRLADLPNHPAMQIFRPVQTEGEFGSPGHPAARETPAAHAQPDAACVDRRVAVTELG
jgi:hypothetical protein